MECRDRVETEQQPDGFLRHSQIFDDGSRFDHWINGDHFITEYELFNGFPRTNYIVYRAVGARKACRLPWTVDNKRISTGPLFSLEEAKALVSESK
jgi:hypothetical protein